RVEVRVGLAVHLEAENAVAKEYSLGYLKQTNAAGKVMGNRSATVWDIGDGILCFEMHSEANPDLNPIDDQIGEMAAAAVDKMESEFEGLVLYHDGQRAFCAGANLVVVGMYAAQKQWDKLRDMITGFQTLNQRMRYSSKPVVVAPSGLALGGGAELVLSGNAVVSWAELYIGLVEVGVGLIPGGAGNLNLLKSWYGPFSNDRDFDPTPFIKKVFLSIGMAQVAEGAEKAREAGFLQQTDTIVFNRDHLLHTAKERALGMSRSGFTPPRPNTFRLPGPNGFATIDMLLWSMVQDNQISDHDRLIGAKLARVLTGGDTSLNTPVTEEQLLELECEAFISLCGEPKSQERMQYMVMNNKPLRN
ncbi:MAG: enoyl-CoA hydratase/isomerase family protein, partial [Myxococcota bacterium]